VHSNDSQALAYVYLMRRGGTAAKFLTRDGVHRIAANIAKPPELLTKTDET
jgi:hypothetical protein